MDHGLDGHKLGVLTLNTLLIYDDANVIYDNLKVNLDQITKCRILKTLPIRFARYKHVFD